MDNPISGRFISGDVLAKELRARRRRVVYVSVRSRSQAARDALATQKVTEGWRVRKQFGNSIRLERMSH